MFDESRLNSETIADFSIIMLLKTESIQQCTYTLFTDLTDVSNRLCLGGFTGCSNNDGRAFWTYRNVWSSITATIHKTSQYSCIDEI